MILIYAEKAKVGMEIAAALDKITLKDGTKVEFNQIGKYAKQIEKQQAEDLFLDITYKGKPCKVIWGRGHLCSLKREKDYNPSYANWHKLPMPFFPPMETKVNDSGNEWQQKSVKKLFANAKKFFPKAEYIINATDDDREGELLFAYLYEHLECKVPVKRILNSSATKKGICDAFDTVFEYSERTNNVLAGKARSYSDFYIGTNLTAALTLKNPGAGILSCGRLQTTILNIIVKKELSILNFKPETFYTVESEFTSSSGESYRGIHISEQISDKKEAKRIFTAIDGAKNAEIKEVKKTTQKREAPGLYSLSALQIDAGSRLGFTLMHTQDIAQKLYEDGYTTYARTNSQFLKREKMEDIKKVLEILERNVPAYATLLNGIPKVYNHPENYFDDSKVHSHFAIVPTGKPPKGLSGDEALLYDLIAKSVIRTIYPDAEIAHTRVVTDINGEEFVSTGSMITKKGWMEVSGTSKEKMLPSLEEKDVVIVSKVEICDKKTKPPKRFTDTSLVKTLIGIGKELDDKDLRKILQDPKHVGIGTEATRAATVETLISRSYITRDKKSVLTPTEKGIQLIKNLPIEELKSPETTARWEQRLANIEDGKESFESFIEDVKSDVVKWLSVIDSVGAIKGVAKEHEDESVGNCPICGKSVVVKKWGHGCSGYKEGCKFSVGTICGKKIGSAQVKRLLSKGSTTLIKGFKSKSGEVFDAYLLLKDGEVKFSRTQPK